MKRENIYRFILSRKVATSDEIAEYAKNMGAGNYGYIYKAYLAPLVENGFLVRPRRGLYCAVDPYRSEPVDRHILASKLSPAYYLSHHAALDLLGAGHSGFGEVTVATPLSRRFKEFRFENVTYRPFITNDTSTGIVSVWRDDLKLMVSSPSRTFVECVLRPDLCGGLEECLKSVEGLRGVRIQKVLEALSFYKGDLAKRKTGFILSLMSKRSPFYRRIKTSDLKVLVPIVDAPLKYWSRREENILIKDWKLYVPVDLEDMLRGV
jgi:predicted transcriptional regulator of viral defense system